jgi:vancomycin resistance protein YoaR
MTAFPPTQIRVLASFTTSFENRMSDQKENALLASKKLNGLVIRPGETLSFNSIVDTWSKDQGYKKAPVSFSGKLVPAYGGGVCQASTALYNAGLLAGLDIVERHRHEFAPNYVLPGRDAAVAFPNIDLKLRNPYKFAIVVRTRVFSDRLRVDLAGRGHGASVKMSQRVVQVQLPASYSVGQGRFAQVTIPGKPGYQVEIFRERNGARELVSCDSYPSMSRVVFRRNQ